MLEYYFRNHISSLKALFIFKEMLETEQKIPTVYHCARVEEIYSIGDELLAPGNQNYRLFLVWKKILAGIMLLWGILIEGAVSSLYNKQI